MFDAKNFLEDYNIFYDSDGKNCSPGYINIQCPFCSDRSNHGGINIEKEFYSCWKCKDRHSIPEIIKELLGISPRQARQLFYQYQKESAPLKTKKHKPVSKIYLPNTSQHPLPDRHRKYLIKRNFDPDKLEKEFDLYGTSVFDTDYHLRIVAPIYYKNRLVSFQARDITGKQKLRYKACEKAKEIIHHKHVLYNQNTCNKRGVLVEGITDVWRLGKGSCCTFGTGWTQEQLTQIIKIFDHLFILYDQGDEAQERAEKLAYNFSIFRGKSVDIITIEEDDPASMIQSDANYLMKDLKIIS